MDALNLHPHPPKNKCVTVMIRLAFHNFSHTIPFSTLSLCNIPRVVIFTNTVYALVQSIHYLGRPQWSPGDFPHPSEYLLGMVGDRELCCREAEGQLWGLHIMSKISSSCLCFKANYSLSQGQEISLWLKKLWRVNKTRQGSPSLSER